MRKHLFTIALLIFGITAAAQTGIGTRTPAASSQLDITSTNKGLLIPRVALTGTGDGSTISSPATSLLVYNTATAGSGATAVVPGYYYYNGSAWVKVLNVGDNTGDGSIYLNNGVLPTDRIVDMNTKLLSFNNGTMTVSGGRGLFLDNTNISTNSFNNGLHFGSSSGEGISSNRATNTAGTNFKGLDFYTNNVNRMAITFDGNVGVGTLAPGGKFEIAGDAGSNTFASSILLNNTNSTTPRKYSLGAKGAITAGTSSFAIADETASKIRFTISPTGDAAIGDIAASTKLDIDGGLRVRQITSGGGTVMLTADNNGLIRSQTFPAAAAPMVFATLGNGITLNTSNWANYNYTGASITLPPNSKYLVSAVILIVPSVTPFPDGQSIWVRSSFSDSATSFNVAPTQGSRLISGSISATCTYGLLMGAVVISNTTADNKTYYYWAGLVENNKYQGSINSVASSVYGENQIYAIPVN